MGTIETLGRLSTPALTSSHLPPLKSPFPDFVTAFFDKFNQLVDSPEAVATVRQLILYFAVAGKLSTRRPDDAPVSQLVDALSKAKLNRGKTRGRTSAAIANNNSDTVRPVRAPAHWAWVPLNEIGSMSGGMTPSKAKSVFWDGDVNWFSSKDIKKDELTESELKITRVGAESTGLQVYSPGCLVMVARSGILKRTFPVSILRVEGTVNQDLKVLHPYIPGLERYLQIMLLGLTGFILTSLVKTGMTVQSLVYEEFEVQPFPLPPLDEQKRIVAKVDELMAQCDRLEAQLKARDEKHAVLARAALARFAESPTIANLELLFHDSFAITPADLRKTILTLAVQGKLIPQDPRDEPVEDLLARTLTERRKLERTDATEVAQLDASDALGHGIPKSWRWQRLDDILIFGPTNGFSPKAVEYETSVRSLTLSATTSGRFKSQHSKFITTEFPADSEIWLRDGDLLVQRGNSIEYVGVSAVYRGEPNCFVYPDLMMKLRVFSAFDVGYVHLAMSHDASRNFLRARASGTSGSMPKINQTTLKSLPVPIPPFAEQRRIVKRVDELMFLVDRLETQLTASRVTAANLLSALVAELTGNPNNGKVSVSSDSGTGRRGRPRKS